MDTEVMMQSAVPSPPARLVKLEDIDARLEGVIAIHSATLGPAAGGCRLWGYPDLQSATDDAVRLAAGMTYKNALAGLPFGGGKAVIRLPDEPFDREALFAAYGRAVESLGGEYVTAEDVGTSVNDMAAVQRETSFVAGLAAQSGRPGGDPSPHTARGVFEAMAVAVEHRLEKELSEVTVAVQGLGHVGFDLCERLHRAGAKLVVCEPRADVAAKAAARFGADVRSVRSIYDAKVDVFAPCALGGSLNSSTVKKLQAKVVCGAANNQLAEPSTGQALAERGVLYAPDYLVNAGGIVNVAGEYLGWSSQDVEARVDAIAHRFKALLAKVGETGERPECVADQMALDVLSAAANRDKAA
ncbi:MAG: Glu/Leu/Phe/Val dehydrogenase dimerization domain-containing protein [Pseudomonadota bacterium]